MNDRYCDGLEMRMLLLVPTVADGVSEQIYALLTRAGIACVWCADQVQVCEQLTAGAAAILIAEEVVRGGDGCLAEWLGRQSPWSDLPVLILARTGAHSAEVARAMEELGNVTVLERTAQNAALISAVRTALRARRRQYESRDRQVQHERLAEQLRMSLKVGHAAAFTWDIPSNKFWRLPDMDKPDTLEEVVAKVHPGDRHAFERQVQHAIKQPGREYSNDYRVLGPNGSVRWMSDVGQVEFSADEKPLRLIGLTTEITHRKQDEEALRSANELERNYRVLADATSEIPYRMSADWSTMLPLDGLRLLASSERPLGDWAWMDQYLPPDEQGRVRQTIEEAIAAKRLFEMEHRVLRLDGSTGWVHSRSVPMFDGSENVVGWFGVVCDITGRKQSEKALVESEHRLGAILDQLPVAVSVMNFDGQVTLTNPPMRRFVPKLIPSIDPQRRIRWRSWKTDGSPLEPDDWPGQRAIRGETVVPGVDFLFTDDDGRELWTNVATSPLRDASGSVTGAVVVIQDIDDRTRANEALRESETRLGAVLRLSPVGIIRTDAAGRITLVNPHWCQMLGYAEKELLGRNFAEFVHPSFTASTEMALDNLVTGSPTLQIDKAYGRKDGSVLRAQSNVAAIRSPTGDFLGTVRVVQDISERLNSEKELRRLAAELTEADQRKDVFVATLAHELRNPLAPIRNGLEMIKLSPNNGEAVENVLAMMDRQLTHLVRLVDDLLDVSRITQGKVELRKERVDLKAVVDAAVETSRPAIEQAGHELVVIVTDEPTFVYGDAARLAQVVSNLLLNAAKYTHRGGHIRLTVGREDAVAIVSVKDDGIGIPPDMIERVFTIFAQLDRTLEKTTGGLGIGLSLVKGLLEMHGGNIEAHSDGERMGSEFVARLPAVIDILAQPDRSGGKHSEVVQSGLHRILVVDDNVDSANSLGQLLQLLGNEVRVANDGEAGIGVAAQFRPDLVLMDIGMPKLNGYEAARRIRQQAWGQGMVLVALTGWGQDDDRKKSADAGFDHHLVKPVEMDVLMKVINSP